MAGFGSRLQRERRRRDITLAEVSEATKISLRYLRALEREEFARLPGGVFNRGYVRAYAKFLGADADDLVRAYVAAEKAEGVEDKTEDDELLRQSLAASVARRPQPDGVPYPGRGKSIAAVVIAVAVMTAVGAWIYLPQRFAGRSTMIAAGSAVPAEPPVTRDTRPSAAPLPREPEQAPVETTVEKPVRLPAVEPPPAASGLDVTALGVGTAVVDHQLRGRADRFEEGTEVWFWTRIVGGRRGDRVRHVWYHEGDQIGVAVLTLGGSHWRTQSRRTLEPGSAGQWTVEVRDADDTVLARERFDCTPSQAAAGWRVDSRQ